MKMLNREEVNDRMINKKIFLSVAGIVITGATLLGVSTSVHAQESNSRFTGLAQAIAVKFSLNQSDVQNVISSYMQQEMQQRQKNRLDKLVGKGKITNAQETLILGELATLQSQYSPSSMRGMTKTQRQQAMKDRKNAIAAWANSQNPKINPSYLILFGGGWHKSPTTMVQ